jgi:hypothetical protein
MHPVSTVRLEVVCAALATERRASSTCQSLVCLPRVPKQICHSSPWRLQLDGELLCGIGSEGNQHKIVEVVSKRLHNAVQDVPTVVEEQKNQN